MSQNRSKRNVLGTVLKMLPLFILLGLTPFYIRYSYLEMPVLKPSPYNKVTVVHDIFTYGKAQLIYLSGFLSLIGIFFEMKKNDFNHLIKSKVGYLIGALVCWLVLTTIFSIFRTQAVWGAPEKYEGLFAWLSYLSFFIYSGLLLKDRFYQILIFRTILFSGLIMTMIGTGQFFEMDLIRQLWFKNLVFPKEIVNSLNFVFEANRVYSTLYNPNFVAMYVATIFPLSVYMIFSESKRTFKGLWFIFSIMLIINLVGSKSSGGILGLAVALVTAVALIAIKKFFNNTAKFLQIGLFSSFVILAVGFIIGFINLPQMNNADSISYNLSSVEIEGHQATFVYKGKPFIVKANTDSLKGVSVYDGNQKQVEIAPLDNVKFKLNHPAFEGIVFEYGVYYEDQNYVSFLIDGVNWPLLMGKDGFKYINSTLEPVNLIHSKGLGGYVGNEKFGSARGFIWSRTLPTLLSSPIVGYGADTFSLAFPQSDNVMKYHMYGNPGIIVDKAHNLYLQLASNFGIPGLLLFVSLIVYSITNLATNYSKKQQVFISCDLGVILCLVGYLGAGMFYDSNLHVSPFFYVLLGVGLLKDEKLSF